MRQPVGMPPSAAVLEVLTGDGVPAPRGFRSHAANIGIKDDTPDFSVLAVDPGCAATAAGDAVFTRSLFAGASVTLSRAHLAVTSPRAVVTVSKNANVATGVRGAADARRLAEAAAGLAGVDVEQVVVASTGVIGRPYPDGVLQAHLDTGPRLGPADLAGVARAIMTTDTRPKLAAVRVGDAVVAGVAKGVGMIEPDMATLLVYLVTDAGLPAGQLAESFRRVVGLTFNSLSIDTDTSTSDSCVLLSSGAAGPVDAGAFTDALYRVALSLVHQIAADGEGATKLLQVSVTGAVDDAQAKRVAKAIVNSPLVKTAVHGADPNWGRVVMAIGKCSDEKGIDPERVRVAFGDVEVYPATPDAAGLEPVSAHLRGAQVDLVADLGAGDGAATVWGCDLSDGYVRINADYTT